MIRFNNDYSCGAHPAILRALEEINTTPYGGYGTDPLCSQAVSLVKKDCGLSEDEADVHFLVGGTQTNYVLIYSALRPYQSVLSPVSGHINVHETGAVENCGHKIETLPTVDGKIKASDIEKAAVAYNESTVREHITCPKMVYISYPTEFGTLYSKAELQDIYSTCRKYGLYLFIDGARMAYGLAAGDLKAGELAHLCDAFYFGGTKCGALFGEALVIRSPELRTDFRSYMKQSGAMLAKGWLLGIQFCTLFKDGLYYETGRHAVSLALKIREAFLARGIKPYIDSPTNQQFVVLSPAQAEKLSEKYIYEFEGTTPEGNVIARFCTSWSTEERDVLELIEDIKNL